MTYIFFTLRDFKKVGGGSIRIYGVVNALAESGERVILISGVDDYTHFHSAIEHIKIDNRFYKKAILQGLTSILPANVVVMLFPKLFENISKGFQQLDLNNYRLFFFEYLDNTIAYLLKKTGKINHYINDVHGIATIEFDYQRKNENSFVKRMIASIKNYLAIRHDKRVFENADGIIFSSFAMKDYLSRCYSLSIVKDYILPNLISSSIAENPVDEIEVEKIRKELGIRTDDFVLFFGGGFKQTSGVDDLIKALSILKEKYKNLKLILIGDGPLSGEVDKLILEKEIEKNVFRISSVPYEDLKNYQSLANLIVCPDRYNEFSNMILHLKYLDALVSGKIVLNGSFESIKEVNKEEKLSVNFIPSNFEDFLLKLEYCIINEKELINKYKNTANFAFENLSYKSQIHVLTE